MTLRLDVVDSNGVVTQSGVQCASLGAQASSHSANTSVLLKSGNTNNPEPGQEVETHNLLIISQNTFEGKETRCILFCKTKQKWETTLNDERLSVYCFRLRVTYLMYNVCN